MRNILPHTVLSGLGVNIGMGRGTHSPHTKLDMGEDTHTMPTIRVDYCYLTVKDQEQVPPILIMKCDTSKAIFSHHVQHKGNAEEWIIDRVRSHCCLC